MSGRVLQLVARLAPLVVLLCGCAGQLQQLPAQSAACAEGIVPAEGAAVLQQAEQSATSAPGAPSWNDFAKGQLLAQGVNLAICIGLALVHDLDAKLLPTTAALADASGHIMKAARAEVVEGASCPDPKLLLAHDRVVDFLQAHGVKHTHKTPTPAPAPAQ